MRTFKLYLIIISFGILFITQGLSQTARNYIIEEVYNTQTETLINTDKNISINYYDGLGRPIQGVQVGASPTGKNIVQHIEYDSFGREVKKFLPYTSEYGGEFYTEDAKTKQYDFYQGILPTSENVKADLDPWSEVIMEASPINRVLQQGAPGTTWQPKTNEPDNSVHFEYETNISNEVIYYEVDASNNLVNSGYFNANTLYKNGTRDENEVWSYGYTNSQGQVILKESDPTGLSLKTYYVYDDFGLLRYVLPPKAVELAGTTTPLDVNNPIISNLCIYYEYDYRNRMTIKKLPGQNRFI